MALIQFLGSCAVVAGGISVGFCVCVLLCTNHRFQRQLFYLHRAPIGFGQKLDEPESFGFLHNQVHPLHIPTSDGERLYAWLVTPLALYARNEENLLDNSEHLDVGIKLLENPESRLVIYFHGNAGTVGQTRRTDAYRNIASSASRQIHVLAFDYRGFGRSTGSPTELGLINDALSVIRWATTIAKIPTTRIVLVAQSLGTGVAIGAVDALLRDDPSTEFAGLLLCAAFTDAVSALTTYRIAGFIPILAPLRHTPTIYTWFESKIRDTWDTRKRLRSIVRRSRKLKLTLLAAENDEVIPYQHTEELYDDLTQEASATYTTPHEISLHSDHCKLDAGGQIETWQRDHRLIKKILVHYGGHNGIMKWAPVALEVFKSFGL